MTYINKYLFPIYLDGQIDILDTIEDLTLYKDDDGKLIKFNPLYLYLNNCNADIKVIKYLVGKRNIKDDGWYCLDIAIRYENKENIEYLYSEGFHLKYNMNYVWSVEGMRLSHKYGCSFDENGLYDIFEYGKYIPDKTELLFELVPNLKVSENMTLYLLKFISDSEFLKILKHTECKTFDEIVPQVCEHGMSNSLTYLDLKHNVKIGRKEFRLMLNSTNFEMIDDYKIRLKLNYHNFLDDIFTIYDDEHIKNKKLNFYGSKIGEHRLKQLLSM